jgi:hypothetical protein
MRLFRERLLVRLVARHAISTELAHKLLSWRHPGFSVHVGEPIAASDAPTIEDIAGPLDDDGQELTSTPFGRRRAVSRRPGG